MFTVDHDTGIIYWSSLFLFLFIEKCTSSLFRNNILVHMDHDTENEGKANFIDVEKQWSTVLEKGIDQLTNAQITGLKFSSLDDGGEFYNTYAKLVGFSICKDEIKHNKDNIVTSRRWVCAKEGLRIRKNEANLNCLHERPITRSDCKAAFRIRFE